MEMRIISYKELQSCPKKILAPSHWLPYHKINECGAKKKIKARIKARKKQV